jgi:hypothetical protein
MHKLRDRKTWCAAAQNDGIGEGGQLASFGTALACCARPADRLFGLSVASRPNRRDGEAVVWGLRLIRP